MTAATENRPGVADADSAASLRAAYALLRAGDNRRASGKAWDAVARNLRAIADERGWQRAAAGTHEEVGDLIRAASRLAKESENPKEIRDLCMRASMLYVNSLEDWHDGPTVRMGVDAAGEVIGFLERISVHPIVSWLAKDATMKAISETVQSAETAAALREAVAMLRVGDMRRASGKAWQAVAGNLRAIADERGWQRAETGTHNEVGDLIKIGGFLAKETDDRDKVDGMMGSAAMLYVYSQEDHYEDSELSLQVGIDEAREFVTILERLNGARPAEQGKREKERAG